MFLRGKSDNGVKVSMGSPVTVLYTVGLIIMKEELSTDFGNMFGTLQYNFKHLIIMNLKPYFYQILY